MTFEDERQPGRSGTPPEDEARNASSPGANPGAGEGADAGADAGGSPNAGADAAGSPNAGADAGGSPNAGADATAAATTPESSRPPEPAWPSAPPVSGPGWPPAPPAYGQGWPPAPSAPQGWPPAPPAWPPAPPAWPPAPPAWPPAPQGWPPVPPQPQELVPGTGSEEWSAAGSQPPRRRANRAPQILGLIAAIMIAFAGGMVVDHFVAAAQPAPSAQVPLKDFAVYEQALQIIRDNYVGASSVTDQQLLYGSIGGMVDSLGDTGHSRFLTPTQYQRELTQLSGQVAGIGVLVNEANGVPIVDRVIAGSPAEAAGVKAGDQITAVDGTNTEGMTFDQLAALIRGNPGTKVTVSVIHSGATTSVDIVVTRAEVKAPLVDWGIVPGTHIADIALYEFDRGAGTQVVQAIRAAAAGGATSIVFDLRSNPGGYADEARNVASEFLSSGVIYMEEDSKGNRTEIKVDTSISSTKLPMVVLVDHGTASAAEIVSGALQDNHRAKVIGLTTVGTGTVLQPFTLSDGSVVLLGTSDWLTPLGHRIFGKGITPDQTVALPTGATPIDPIDLTGMTVAKLQSSGDAELLAALKALGS